MDRTPALKTLGVFCDGPAWADLWFNQCDLPGGRHKGIQLRPYDGHADHLVLMGNMPPDVGGYKDAGLGRRIAKLQGRRDAWVLEQICDRLGRAPSDMSMVVYEPGIAFSDAWYEVANKRFVRVYGPDERASNPIVLPVMWSFIEGVAQLRDEKPNTDRPIGLGCVTSGKSDWPGHRDRLAFLRALCEDGIPLELFGMNLPQDLGGRGPVQSKGSVLRGARFTLAIENDAGNDRYVTEKLWDPLISWSLPLYFGSRAADSLIPMDSFIRLPDLGRGGLEVIREVLSRPAIWEERLDAIEQARKLILGEHRLVELFARIVDANA